MRKLFRKYIRVLRELFYLRFHSLTVFRLDFFAPFFIDGSLFLIQLAAFRAVYANIDTIGGWGKGEMILYIGTISLLNAVNMTIFFFGVTGIPDKIRSGKLDLYLTKPISPLFHLTFESISPGSIPLILMSLCIIVYGVTDPHIAPDHTDHLPPAVFSACDGIGNTAAYMFWVLIMVILYYDMEVLLRSVSLYTVSMARLEQIEEAGIGLCMKLPGIAFHGIYKIIFYLILPYGIMATLPVQSMIGEMNPQLAAYGIGVVVMFTGITGIIWKHGLKHYNSTGS